MEKVLVKGAKVIFPGSSLHQQVLDLRIEDGILQEVGDRLQAKSEEKVFSGHALKLFPGFVDVGTECNEPGFEQRETITSLQAAGTAGGYTHLAVMPNTQPVADNKSVIRYLLNESGEKPRLWPLGALSQNCEGKDIASYFEMFEEGVRVFTDGDLSVQASDLILRAMEYSSAFGGIVMHHPEDKFLAGNGMAHESIHAVQLGLKTKPAIAEVLQVIRDLELASFASAPLILHKLSLPASIQKVQEYRSTRNLQIAVSVSVNNLLFNEQKLENFDSNFKFRPVLRTNEDQTALWDCVKNGEIDFLVSDHRPREVEEKVKEFDLAKSGASGLQTTVPALFDRFYSEITEERWVDLLSFNPRKWLQIPLPVLECGQPVDVTLLDSQQSWVYSTDNNQSASTNSPWMGHSFQTKILGTFYKSNPTK